jgi:DNA-directed RNA polymerase subunit alpha
MFTVQDDRDISGELYVNKGRGYVEAEQHPVDRTMPVDVVRIDSIYNPVRRANFTVAETRVGQRTDYDRLTLTVETNGTISPEDAVAYAAALAQEHFRFFVDFGKVPVVSGEPTGNGGTEGNRLRDVLGRAIDEAGLSVRSINSLKNSNIRTIGDLVRYREEDLLKVKNVGEKALGEIAELLRREGLNFGMELEESDGEIRIVDPGTAPQAQLTAGEDE